MHKKMIVTWIMILLPGLLQAFECKGTRLYKEHGADENISQFIRESLKNSPDLQELFALGEQDYKKFVDDRILQDYSSYFDGVSTGQGDSFYGANADVATEILKIHDQAVAHISPLIRKKIEPKLHKVLFDILQDSSKNIEKINDYAYHVASEDSHYSDKAADEILNYAVLHRKLHFQIYPVLEFMINTDNYKPSVMQFIVDNFTITQKVTRVDRVNQLDAWEQTHLMKACQDISEQALLKVKFLIHCKADLNAKSPSRFGSTALMFACKNEGAQAFDVVQYLVGKGAYVNQKNPDDDNLLIVACTNEGAQAFNMVQYLVEKGADVNRQNKNGETPLMIACYNKGPEAFNIIQHLVEKGADLNAQGPEKLTLLMIACVNSSPQAFDIVQYLVEKGADLNAQDKYGRTSLMYACVNRGSLAFDIVQYLVEKGADLNAQNQDGLTLLMIACGNVGPQALNIVEFLVEKGADLNAQNQNGKTPLMYACAHKGPQAFNMVKYLLDCGADKNLRTLSGQTAFDWAVTQEIKDLLENYQPKVS